MSVATYDLGSRTRTLSVDIDIVDGGLGSGSWTASGSVAMGSGGLGHLWTAFFYDGFSGGIVPPPVDDDEPTPDTRRCDLTLSPGGGTWSMNVTGTTHTGTVEVNIPTKALLYAGSAFGFNGAKGYDKQSANATTSITLLGHTASRSVSGSAEVAASWVLLSQATIGGKGQGSQTLTITDSPGECDAAATSVSKTETGISIPGSGGGTWSHTSAATTSGTVLYVSAQRNFTGALPGPTTVTTASAQLTPDIACAFHGRLNRLMAVWPDPFEYRLYDSQPWQSTATGTISADALRQTYDCYSQCYDSTNTSFQTLTDRERITARGALHPMARYTSIEGITYENPLFIHGPQWDAIGLSHTNPLSVDDGSTLTPSGNMAGVWSASSGGSVAVVSGAIELTGTAGKKLKRTFTAEFGKTSFGSYSMLRLKLKASAADHAITLRLDVDIPGGSVPYVAPRWQLQTGTADTYTEHLIDLGVPNNDPDFTTRGRGIYAELGLEDLGAGSYTIDLIGLETSGDGMGGYTEPLVHLFPPQTSGQPGIWGIADGNECYRLFVSPDMAIHTAVTNAQTPGLTGYAGGWDIDSLSPPTSPGAEPWPESELTTNRHPMSFMGGGGLLWDGATTTWTKTFDGDAAVPGSLSAQWLVQTLEWGFADTWGGFLTDDGAGGYIVGGGLAWGSSAWGRVVAHSDSASPVGKDGMSGETVTLKDWGGSVLATTTTDADGFFSLPSLASTSNAVRLEAVGRSFGLSLGWFRSRYVIEPYVPPDGTLLAMACSATQRVCRAYKTSGGELILEFRRRPAAWDAVSTGLTLSGSGALAYDRQDAAQRLWLVHEDGSDIKSRYTDDEGANWSMATTIFSSASHPAIATSPTGLRHYFGYSSGAIKTKVLDGQGNVTTAETTVVASGVADAALDAVHDGQELLLTYKNGSGAVITVVSIDGGLTFT